MEKVNRPYRSGAVMAYLSLLAFHVAHVLEEIFGGFVVLDMLGLGRFLAMNWVLFCVPLGFFYFWLIGRRWAHWMSILYAGFMVLNGFGHNALTLAKGRYFNGYAGGFSGIGLIISGLLLILALRRKDAGRPERS